MTAEFAAGRADRFGGHRPPLQGSTCSTSSSSSRRFRRTPATSAGSVSRRVPRCISCSRSDSRSTIGNCSARDSIIGRKSTCGFGPRSRSCRRRRSGCARFFFLTTKTTRAYYDAGFQAGRLPRLRPRDERSAGAAARRARGSTAHDPDARHAQPESGDRGGDRAVRSSSPECERLKRSVTAAQLPARRRVEYSRPRGV